MSDGPDQLEAPHARGPSAGRTTGLALAGLVCLGAAAAAGVALGREGWREYRKVFLYRPAPAVVCDCQPPAEETDEQGRAVFDPGWVAYEFVLGDRLFTGASALPAPRRFPTGYELDLAGPQDAGAEITVYYDPDDPAWNAVEPVADPRLAVGALLLLPVAAWGVWFLFRGVGPRRSILAKDGQSPPTAMRGLSVSFLIAYSALSLLGAASVQLGAPWTTWQKAWILAAGLAPAVPLSSLLVGAVWSDAVARKARAAAGGPASESQAQEEMPPRRRGLWAMAAVLIAGGLAVAGLSGYLAGEAAWRQWDALRRLSTGRGTVLSSDVEALRADTPGGPVVRYRPYVRFFYRAGRDEYVSDRLAREPVDYADESRAWADANKFPRNLPVSVYYDLAAPAEGVLRPPLPVERPQWFLPAPLAVATGVLCAVWGASLPWGTRRVKRFLDAPAEAPWRIPSLGVLRECAAGVELHRRRGWVSAAWLGYAAVAGVIVAAATWRQERSGEAMSMGGVVYGLISCLCAAAACGLLAGRRTRLHLVLDTNERLLTAGNDRRGFTIPFDDLAAWTVAFADAAARRGPPTPATSAGKHPNRARRGGRPSRDRTPVLGIRTADGQEAALHLFTGPAPWPLRLAAARKTADELARITGSEADVTSAEENSTPR